VERPAMIKHGIRDIRYFYGNDLRFLRQFWSVRNKRILPRVCAQSRMGTRSAQFPLSTFLAPCGKGSL